MVTVEAALHGDRLRDVDTAGAGIRVEVEVGVADYEADRAAACTELPVGGRLACSFDFAAACAGFEGAGESAKANAAAAGFGFDIAGSGLLEFNIAGAGSECRGTLDAVGPDSAGAALGLDVCADVLDLHIAGAGGCADAGGFGEGDVVVDADIAVEVVIVAFADGDVITVLDDGRVVHDLLDAAVDVASAAHPAVAGAEMGDDVDLVVRSGSEMDVTGAGGDRDVGRAADVESAVEVAVGGEGCGGGEGEGCGCVGEDFDGHGISF